MARYTFQYQSGPLPGRDEEYNRWYDDVHMPDILGLPGFLSCRRYRILSDAGAAPRYIAAYEVESDNPQQTLAGVVEAAKDMVISPALDRDSVSVVILEARAAAA